MYCTHGIVDCCVSFLVGRPRLHLYEGVSCRVVSCRVVVAVTHPPPDTYNDEAAGMPRGTARERRRHWTAGVADVMCGLVGFVVLVRGACVSCTIHRGGGDAAMR